VNQDGIQFIIAQGVNNKEYGIQLELLFLNVVVVDYLYVMSQGKED